MTDIAQTIVRALSPDTAFSSQVSYGTKDFLKDLYSPSNAQLFLAKYANDLMQSGKYLSRVLGS